MIILRPEADIAVKFKLSRNVFLERSLIRRANYSKDPDAKHYYGVEFKNLSPKMKWVINELFD
jgi:hypothetical protein